MSKSKVVEFVGMPGSGKTFFEKKIFKNINKKIIRNNFSHLNRLNKLRYIIFFIINYPNFFFKSIIIILKKILIKK